MENRDKNGKCSKFRDVQDKYFQIFPVLPIISEPVQLHISGI